MNTPDETGSATLTRKVRRTRGVVTPVNASITYLNARFDALVKESAAILRALNALRGVQNGNGHSNGHAHAKPNGHAEWITLQELALRLGTSRAATYQRLKYGSLRGQARKLVAVPGQRGRSLLISTQGL